MKYIGQTGRTLEERIKEHERDARTKEDKDIKNISGLSEHMKKHGHTIKRENIRIVAREKDYKKRLFKEAMLIIKEKEKELMNKKEEKVEVSNIWRKIL